MAKKIFVLGGDGFCGWPTALHLSALGHEIVIIDNLSRRRIDAEMGVRSLTPIASIDTRLQAWREVSGKTIRYQHIDIAQEFARLAAFIAVERPDAVVHFAEQRSAPYSMRARSRNATPSTTICAARTICWSAWSRRISTVTSSTSAPPASMAMAGQGSRYRRATFPSR
jgi:UDP-sulfoquinovose synthase